MKRHPETMPIGIKVGTRTVHTDCSTSKDRRNGQEFSFAAVYPYGQKCSKCGVCIAVGEVYDRRGRMEQFWGGPVKLLGDSPIGTA
jgi:hypothetical protein